MKRGQIKDIIVRSDDILINYTDDRFPLASGWQILIGKDELLGLPFAGESIEVETTDTGSVIHVSVGGKTILKR